MSWLSLPLFINYSTYSPLPPRDKTISSCIHWSPSPLTWRLINYFCDSINFSRFFSTYFCIRWCLRDSRVVCIELIENRARRRRRREKNYSKLVSIEFRFIEFISFHFIYLREIKISLKIKLWGGEKCHISQDCF